MRIGPSVLVQMLLLVASTASLPATELQVANLFSDGAVIQRGMTVPVWGTGTPGAQIRVTFAGQMQKTTVDDDGRWRVILAELTASSVPQTLTVSDADNALQIRDMLVGEVWLCSGQSNMAMRVDLARDAEDEKATSDLPLIRVHTVAYAPARKPLTQSSGQWVKAGPDTAGQFSAIAFFFGRELHRKLKVPVGLIVAARGGSDITTWTSRTAQQDTQELNELLKSWEQKVKAWTPEIEAAAMATYEKEFPKWKAAVQAAAKAGQRRPPRPAAARTPVHPAEHHHHPATLFNGMIHPLIPYAIQGVIWYQGESNAFTGEQSALYEKQLPLLIQDWRERWGRDHSEQGNFPFAWVQLPFTSARQVAWARIRESMRRGLFLPNTGMVVTLDLGEENLLHPKNKQAFAHRLAQWARAEVYGEDIPWSGPLFKSARAAEKGVLLRFEHDDRLRAIEEPLVGFEYRSGDNDWTAASARIQNNRVVVQAPAGVTLNAVRYAWGNKPVHNLVNSAGLPTSPFVTEFAAVKSSGVRSKRPRKPAPPDLVKTPLAPADITKFPGETESLEIFLLMGQSNMKGRGKMPDRPFSDPQIVMMHKPGDGYFLARHPLHLTGDPDDFSGSDNAGVGPGLSFARAIAKARPKSRILLVPCAVGGTGVAAWQKGQRLYEETVRKARLALKQAPQSKARISAALWLQGESDSTSPEKLAAYQERLDSLIAALRSDLNSPRLPFIACTIGELKESNVKDRMAINKILLDLPNRIPQSACIDSRKFAKSIGDMVHFDTHTQHRHGQLYAAEYLELSKDE